MFSPWNSQADKLKDQDIESKFCESSSRVLGLRKLCNCESVEVNRVKSLEKSVKIT